MNEWPAMSAFEWELCRNERPYQADWQSTRCWYLGAAAAATVAAASAEAASAASASAVSASAATAPAAATATAATAVAAAATVGSSAPKPSASAGRLIRLLPWVFYGSSVDDPCHLYVSVVVGMLQGRGVLFSFHRALLSISDRGQLSLLPTATACYCAPRACCRSLLCVCCDCLAAATIARSASCASYASCASCAPRMWVRVSRHILCVCGLLPGSLLQY